MSLNNRLNSSKKPERSFKRTAAPPTMVFECELSCQKCVCFFSVLDKPKVKNVHIKPGILIAFFFGNLYLIKLQQICTNLKSTRAYISIQSEVSGEYIDFYLKFRLQQKTIN